MAKPQDLFTINPRPTRFASPTRCRFWRATRSGRASPPNKGGAPFIKGRIPTNLIRRIWLASSIFVFLAVPLFSLAGNIDATNTNAWAENTGLISLNCSNDSSCATTDYKVLNSNGTLTGNAWGENVGWVVFDPTDG